MHLEETTHANTAYALVLLWYSIASYLLDQSIAFCRYFTTVVYSWWLSIQITDTFLIAQLVKNLPAMQKIPVQFLDQEGPLEKG